MENKNEHEHDFKKSGIRFFGTNTKDLRKQCKKSKDNFTETGKSFIVSKKIKSAKTVVN